VSDLGDVGALNRQDVDATTAEMVPDEVHRTALSEAVQFPPFKFLVQPVHRVDHD